MQQNACWVFETVQIISIKTSLICFTEKVYGSSPYSPKVFHFSILFIPHQYLFIDHLLVGWSIEMKALPHASLNKQGIMHSSGSNPYLFVKSRITYSSFFVHCRRQKLSMTFFSFTVHDQSVSDTLQFFCIPNTSQFRK